MKRSLALVTMLLCLGSCGGGSAVSPAPLPPAGHPGAAALALDILRGASGLPQGVRVTWPRVNVAGVQGYYIYRATSSFPAGPADSFSAQRVNGGALINAGNPGTGTATQTFDDLFGAAVGTTYYYRLTVVNSTGNESNFSSELSIPIAQHTVTTVAQAGGAIGDQVTITGTWFGAARSGDEVLFSRSDGTLDVAAAATDYVSWSQTQIVVKVPYGAADGPVAVKVGGISVASTAPQLFDYAEPALTTVLPVADWAGHDWITLTGSQFGPAPNAGGTETRVWFGAEAAQAGDIDMAAWTGTSIKVKVPADAPGELVQVVVDVAGNLSSGRDFTVLPRLVSLSVPSAAALSNITLNGTGFGAAQGTGGVSVNGAAASIVSWSNSAVTVTVPATATDGAVLLVRDDAAASAALDLDVIPAVTGADPFRRMAGEQLTISGGGFGAVRGASSVTCLGGGGVPVVNYVSWSSSQIVLEIPAGAVTGLLQVQVVDASIGADLDSATSSTAISILLPPPAGWGGIGQL